MISRMFYGTKAVLRMILYVLLSKLVKEGNYAKPENVGYKSWLDLRGKTLAFRKLDGSLQFYW